MKRYLNSLFLLSQLASLTAMNALARPVKLPPPPPPPILNLDAVLAIFHAVSSFILP